MSKDRVRIDPEFRASPPEPDDARSRRLRRVGLGAILVSAIIWVWLPTTGPQPADEAPPPITALSTTTAWSVPLAEAVPGFADTITTLTWGDDGVDVLRWRPDQAIPEPMMAFAHGPGGRSRALDASGRWYGEIRDGGVLAVQAVGSDPPQPGSVVAEGARSSAWHGTDPGRLAWLACPEAGPAGTLHTIDVTARVSTAELMLPVDGACGAAAAWLAAWGDWGVLLETPDGEHVVQTLLDPTGTRVATGSDAPGDSWMIAGGSNSTTIWTVDPLGPEPTSFMLSADGERRRPVPGLAAEEWLDAARPSPDGSLLALLPRRTFADDPVVRIVDSASGAVVAEFPEPSWEIWAIAWSTDSRFFLYQRWPDVLSNWAGVPRDVELAFADPVAGTKVAVPLPQYAGVIRITDV